MLRIRNVLYPTDFSRGAELAFPHALYFAELFGAHLRVLHVEALSAADPVAVQERLTDLQSAYEELRAWAVAELEELGGERRREGPALETVEARGLSPGPAILQHVEQHDIDLVVLGTHGRRGLRRLLLGSVAEQVVRRAPCPVVTVRERGRPTPVQSVDRIAVPVDLSGRSQVALGYAKELASSTGARLEILHVIQSAPEASDTGVRHSLVRRLREASGPEVRAKIHVEGGIAPERIARFAAREEADLVVLVSHGRTGARRLLLGSVAERVIRLCPCPVFTAKVRGKDLRITDLPGRRAGLAAPSGGAAGRPGNARDERRSGRGVETGAEGDT